VQVIETFQILLLIYGRCH